MCHMRAALQRLDAVTGQKLSRGKRMENRRELDRRTVGRALLAPQPEEAMQEAEGERGFQTGTPLIYNASLLLRRTAKNIALNSSTVLFTQNHR